MKPVTKPEGKSVSVPAAWLANMHFDEKRRCYVRTITTMDLGGKLGYRSFDVEFKDGYYVLIPQ